MADEVMAYCGSCKMDLMATVVARVGGKVAKVLCNTCKKERAYKAAKGVKEPGATAPASAKTTRKKSTESAEEAAASKAVTIEVEWARLMDESTKSARVKYSPKAKLNLGDVVEHPSFGDGVVMRIQHPDKAEILFKGDVKLLIHSRA